MGIGWGECQKEYQVLEAHACNSRTKEAEAGGWKLSGKLGLHHSKFQAARVKVMTPCLTKKERKRKKTQVQEALEEL